MLEEKDNVSHIIMNKNSESSEQVLLDLCNNICEVAFYVEHEKKQLQFQC